MSRLFPSPWYSGERARVRGGRGRYSGRTARIVPVTPPDAPHPRPLPRVQGRGRKWSDNSLFLRVRVGYTLRRLEGNPSSRTTILTRAPGPQSRTKRRV